MIFFRIADGRTVDSRRIILRLLPCLGLMLSTGTLPAEDRSSPFPALYRQGEVFEKAIERERRPAPRDREVTGITVPHHLLAPELIARGFYHASGNRYDRILLLSPDHLRKCRKPFATTDRDFRSALGTVASDSEAVRDLVERCSLVEYSDLFDEEHGIQAILPFVAHFFPDAKLIPLVIRADSTRRDWRTLVEALKPLVHSRTLIVQSTDFSHYLPGAVATRRDQETMNIIASGNQEQLARLRQPDHLDALAAQWIHLVLQSEVFEASCTTIAHANSDQYTSSPQRETTSYLVQVFEKNSAEKSPWPLGEGEARYFFAGDTFLGRRLAHLAADARFAKKVQEQITHLTGGSPLILNLEGVLSPNPPNEPDRRLLVMPESLTLDWLKSLNVIAVSLANNHAHDLGEEGWRHTREKLTRNEIFVLEDGEIETIGPFRIAAFTDLSNQLTPHTERLSEAMLRSSLSRREDLPLFCFLHWGREWDATPGDREEALTRFLFDAGASVIVGCHPHTAGNGVESFRGGRCARIYSTGNFLFDQRSPRASGAMVEARFFETGTYALRWIPVENYFEAVSP